MYISFYVCMYSNTHIFQWSDLPICMEVYMSKYVYIITNIFVLCNVHIIYVFMYVCYVCRYVFMFVCMYV